MKRLRYWVEYLFLTLLLGFCKLLPWQIASRWLGTLAATIGPRMAMNRKALRHIKAALQCDDDTANLIAKNHWRNLGSVIAEFPHIEKIATHHVRFRGAEYLERFRNEGQTAVLFSAHLANWEITPHACLHHYDFTADSVYRAPNNPMVDKKLRQYREANGRLSLHSKSRSGMVSMVKALKSGRNLGLLIDQKYNEGINAPFFDMNARTGTAFIELAKKYDCPLIPIRCIREKDGFLIDVHAPIATSNRDVKDILDDAHALLEKWIKEHPEQWLWLHRRWRSEDLKHV